YIARETPLVGDIVEVGEVNAEPITKEPRLESELAPEYALVFEPHVTDRVVGEYRPTRPGNRIERLQSGVHLRLLARTAVGAPEAQLIDERRQQAFDARLVGGGPRETRLRTAR